MRIRSLLLELRSPSARPAGSRARRGLAAAAVTSAVLSLAACSSDGGTAAAGTDGEKELTVEMNLYSRSLPYFQDVVAGAQERAEAEGVTLNVTYGETDPQLQYDQIQNALSQSPDGTIVVPVDPAALIPVFQQASEGGIPVLTAVNDIEEEGWPYVIGHVGKEYTDIGREKAQYLVETLGGVGTVAMIHGIRGLLFSELQAKGAMEVFAENPGITVIDGPYTGEFSSDAGLEAAENVLTANPDVDALYFDNDDIALGGVLAAQQRGISMDDIVIIGTDGGEPARKSVANGELDMTITLCGVATGKMAMDIFLAYVRDGEEPAERFNDVESQLITPETYDEVEALIAAGDC